MQLLCQGPIECARAALESIAIQISTRCHFGCCKVVINVHNNYQSRLRIHLSSFISDQDSIHSIQRLLILFIRWYDDIVSECTAACWTNEDWLSHLLGWCHCQVSLAVTNALSFNFSHSLLCMCLLGL